MGTVWENPTCGIPVLNPMDVTLREVQMDSWWTPDGVHQEVWLSVTTSEKEIETWSCEELREN